ncbi:hypothetical protein F441_03169 [Phytophthora nicotianae CJ01A1]|nr:hypothetical protein L915_03068 [Phytophthora nicotianae]ETP23756.1 hypothetical protein F441_03169 [Phytophthora nicotianae CJ01A1]ETP51743.1 hypothetical protein F442_03171 [Phytophthora nicotianae P10297]
MRRPSREGPSGGLRRIVAPGHYRRPYPNAQRRGDQRARRWILRWLAWRALVAAAGRGTIVQGSDEIRERVMSCGTKTSRPRALLSSVECKLKRSLSLGPPSPPVYGGSCATPSSQ